MYRMDYISEADMKDEQKVLKAAEKFQGIYDKDPKHMRKNG